MFLIPNNKEITYGYFEWLDEVDGINTYSNLGAWNSTPVEAVKIFF